MWGCMMLRGVRFYNLISRRCILYEHERPNLPLAINGRPILKMSNQKVR